jgi:hypothetical protein
MHKYYATLETFVPGGPEASAACERRGPTDCFRPRAHSKSKSMGKRFFSTVVQPGAECKVELPPCSAIEIQHAALAEGGPLTSRATLECDLATHSFVLCSLPAGGPLQARLGTVVTNDPDAAAWLFLKATGPRPFHVIGRLAVDDDQDSGAAGERKAKRRAAAAAARRDTFDASMVGRYSASALPSSGFAVDEGWATADDVRPTASKQQQQQKVDAGKAAEAIDKAIRLGARTAKGSGLSAKGPNGIPLKAATSSSRLNSDHGQPQRQGGAAKGRAGAQEEADDSDGSNEEDGMIEVLLPDGDDSLGGYSLSDAESEDFVQWMHTRTAQPKQQPKQQPKAKQQRVQPKQEKKRR